MIWRLRARWRLYTVYKFDWDDAGELAEIIWYSSVGSGYSPKEAVDEELSYWGD